MKSRIQLRQELREQILNLSGVTERLNAGIHEDAFFVGGKMFVHIHGHGYCDIQLSKGDQERILAEGKARSTDGRRKQDTSRLLCATKEI
jgi:Family of unknown function (DUF5519)